MESVTRTVGHPSMRSASSGCGRESRSLKIVDSETRMPWYTRNAIAPVMRTILPSEYQNSSSCMMAVDDVDSIKRIVSCVRIASYM